MYQYLPKVINMKYEAKFQFECGNKTCDKCDYFTDVEEPEFKISDYWCELFRAYLYCDSNEKMIRCEECLNQARRVVEK